MPRGTHSPLRDVGGLVPQRCLAPYKHIGGEGSVAHFTLNLYNSTIHLYFNNQAALFAINKMRYKSPSLLRELQRLIQVFQSQGLSVEAFRISSKFNAKADAINRQQFNLTELTIPNQLFTALCKWGGGNYQIDLMASRQNAHLPLHYSWFWEDQALDHNALIQDWSRWEAIYMFSPLFLIPRALQKTQNFQRPRTSHITLDTGRTLVPEGVGQMQQMEAPQQYWDPQYWITELRRLDRLQFLRLALSHKHENTIANSLISAHRASTNRRAQSVWKKFQLWRPNDMLDITKETVSFFSST